MQITLHFSVNKVKCYCFLLLLFLFLWDIFVLCTHLIVWVGVTFFAHTCMQNTVSVYVLIQLILNSVK